MSIVREGDSKLCDHLAGQGVDGEKDRYFRSYLVQSRGNGLEGFPVVNIRWPVERLGRAPASPKTFILLSFMPQYIVASAL